MLLLGCEIPSYFDRERPRAPFAACHPCVAAHRLAVDPQPSPSVPQARHRWGRPRRPVEAALPRRPQVPAPQAHPVAVEATALRVEPPLVSRPVLDAVVDERQYATGARRADRSVVVRGVAVSWLVDELTAPRIHGVRVVTAPPVVRFADPP